MKVFKDPPYNLEFRQPIVVKARAFNAYGWQPLYSPENSTGVTVRREPIKMNDVTVVPVDTTIT